MAREKNGISCALPQRAQPGVAVLLGLRLSQARHEADGNEERAVLAADDLELRGVFLFSAAEAPHGIASHELGNIRSKVTRLQGNLLRRAGHAYGQGAVLATLQGR